MAGGADKESKLASSAKLPGAWYRLFSASVISNLGDGVALIAFPWLASAVTRSGMLISIVVFMQRVPWLIMSLPAGVIADRVDRRRLMVGANLARAALTATVAIAVFVRSDSLPSPDAIDLGLDAPTDWPLYVLLLVVTVLTGTAEVLYDNTAQTAMPSLVATDQLEKANGRLWSTEQVANTLIGPFLGAALLSLAFTVPFALDAATFAISALLLAGLPLGKAVQATSNATSDDGATAASSWMDDLREGFRWLWNHDFLRPLALILGTINFLGTVSTTALILFAQDVLETTPAEFAFMTTGGAVGGVIAGWVASKVSDTIGPGPCLWLTIVGGGLTMIVSGLTSSWIVIWVMFAVFMFTAVLWNVITVSLRQTIIPDHLLGRVNSVYRFFAWGMMSFGALGAGLVITTSELFAGRVTSLRAPWLVAGVLHIAVIFYAGPRLTTTKIEAARAGGGSEPADT